MSEQIVDGIHPSHETYVSDSSLYDYKCLNCHQTDITGGGWGELSKPCPDQKIDYRHRFINRLKEVLGYELGEEETLASVATICNHAATRIERLQEKILRVEIENTHLRNELDLGPRKW